MPKSKLSPVFVPEAEQPYKIPHNWRWVKLGGINRYCPHTVDPASQPDAYFELYSVPSMETNYPEIIPGSEIGSSKQSVQKNDVLLCKINPHINRVWKVSKRTDYELLASSEWVVIRNNRIDPDFMVYCLKSPYFREFMLSHVSGIGGSLMRAQPKHITSYPIPLPPLAEQQRIVERIESLFTKLDAAREKAQAVVDGFELRKAAILYRAFTGKLTEQWRKHNGISLDSWEKTTLSKVVGGFRYGTSEKSAYSYPGMPVLRIPNIGDDGIDFSDMKFLNSLEVESTNQVNENDILIIRSNGSRDLVGKCALVPALSKPFAYASFLIKIVPSDRINPRFLLLYLNSANARAQMFFKAKSSAGIHNINSKELGAISISLPGLREQAKITEIAEDMLSKECQTVSAAQQVIDNIDTMKRAILGRAFRGELGTNDPSEASPDFAVTVR